MAKYMMVFLLILFLLIGHIPAQNLRLSYDSLLEEAILTKWVISHTLTADTLAALMIADGTDDQQTIDAFKNQYNSFLNRLRNEIDIQDEPYDLAEEIFIYLHAKVFKRYVGNARFLDIVNHGSFNAITGSLLYYLLCREFNIRAQMMMGGNYFYSQLFFGDRKVIVNIVDKEGGFNQKSNRKDMIELLVKLGFIPRTEVDLYGVAEIYKKYVQNPMEVSLPELIALFYNNRGYTFLELGNLEKAIFQFEKALSLFPESDMLIANYKSVLYHLSDMTLRYSEFIPYYQNALYLLNDDYTFDDVAITMARRALYYYADEERRFEKATELATDFKLSFPHDKYLVAIGEIERDIEIMWAQTLSNRGFYDSSYAKFRDIYFYNKSSPKNKDMYVESTINYLRYLFNRRGDLNKAAAIIDTLLNEASEYNSVKELYMIKFIEPFNRCITTNKEEAMKIANQAYAYDPNHNFTKMAITRVYIEIALTELRKNNIKKAYNLILKGLNLYPNEPSFIQMLDDIEKTMGYN